MTKLMTSQEVAALLCVAPSTIYCWAQSGKLPSIKLGGVVRFAPADIESFVESSRRLPPPPVPKLGRSRKFSRPDIDRLIDGARRQVIGSAAGKPGPITRRGSGKGGE